MTRYLVGTDEHVVASTTPGPGAEWRQMAVPSGQQHAVPPGEQLALCGVSPAIVWHTLAFTGRGESCPVCLLMSASIV